MNANFSGAWRADLSRSKLLGTSPQAITAHIQHFDLELQEELLVTKADGSQDHVAFRCRTDGDQSTPLVNGTPVRGGARWDGDELLIEIWVQIGPREVHLCDRWSLACEGRTLSMEHREGDLAGQLTVFDRVG